MLGELGLLCWSGFSFLVRLIAAALDAIPLSVVEVASSLPSCVQLWSGLCVTFDLGILYIGQRVKVVR